MNSRRLSFLIMVCAFVLGSASAFAQGILQLHTPGTIERIIIEPGHPTIMPPPIVRPPQPIQPAELVKLEAKVEIDDLVARTSIDQSFRNPNNTRLEGLYLFPLPPNAAVKDLSLYIDGKAVKAEVLEAAKAKKIYEDIVRSMRDPALLEYVGTDLVQLRIFPIEPGQTRRVQFAYSQVMKREFGLCGYTLPLVPTNAAAQPIKELVVTGEIKSSVPIASLYSPTHPVDFVKKDGGKSAKFSMEANGKVPESNLKIFVGVSEKEVGAGFTAYRKGEDGYFLVVLSPRDDLKDSAPLAKDVVFVLDTSGSMSGDKIKQAKKSLEYCLNALHPKDRFNIVRFSTETDLFAKELVEVSDKTRKDAREFVGKFDAAGGTAIQAALQAALQNKSDAERPSLIVFLTDGMPTVGETNIENIEKEFAKQNAGRVRLFTFGIGNDVNTKLLDKLADNNGG
ncbi:TPA: hypothetical protein DDW35_11435, partial [Candidatus Sumerlaeota bacterium]|nr:hypothetical protein [Candidatus Sumerlaeota bacterium]